MADFRGVDSEAPSSLHPTAQRVMTTGVSQLHATYHRLGPVTTLNLGGGALVLIGAFLPMAHAAGMFSAAEGFTTLTSFGFPGFLLLMLGLALAVVPSIVNLSRRHNLIAFGVASFALGVVVAIAAIMNVVGQMSGGYAGGGPGLPLLLLGFAILAYVSFRRTELLEGVWGW